MSPMWWPGFRRSGASRNCKEKIDEFSGRTLATHNADEARDFF
jgi:hypothetical protein